MKNDIFTGLILISGLFLVGIILFFLGIEQKRKKAILTREREASRKQLHDFFASYLSNIKLSVDRFSNFLNFQNGYFSNYLLIDWISHQATLFNEIKDKPYEKIGLSDIEVETIKIFQNYFKNAKTYRDDFNTQFVKDELKIYSLFFDNVEGRKLDSQQRTSIVTDEDNNIVIAGAGSGKTTTIVGKVNYVIDRYRIAPEEILLISFTNKSALTLAGRINIDGVEAKTFHKFGKDIIAEVEGKQPSIFDETQLNPLLAKYFKELINNGNYLSRVTEFFTVFLKPTKSQFEFENQGDYVQYLKDQNFKTYKLKEIPVRGRTTFKMEVVKSIEECRIANFLLFNSIKYEYEFPYEHDTATRAYKQYKPDFTIFQNGKKVYLEHFGVSRHGNVPTWFAKVGETQADAKNKYWEKIEWARGMHESKGTLLIETFSYEMSEDILFEKLTNNLIECGITLRPKSPEEIWEIINEAAQEEINSFIALLQTFISLMKSNSLTIKDVTRKNRLIRDNFQRDRNDLFIEIVEPIIELYENRLSERNEIDFSDMINKATSYLSNRNFNKNFSYVIIDEFQDISIGRYQLIKALKDSNPACKLFCVGDDWQSIYRFSGSDIALFKEFENYFGATEKSKIETTYRFYNPLLNLSSEFIQKNQNQARKELKSKSNLGSTDYEIHYSVTDNQDDTFALKQIFDKLLETTYDIECKEIFILGRYNFDIDRIKNGYEIFNIDKVSGKLSYHAKTKMETNTIHAQFLSVHKAKGLEADIVIIINCNSGKHGFPSEMSDDSILNLLLSEADQYENGEERRLFYVAMTRAREKVFFITDNSFKSKFIAELELEGDISLIKKCPRCVTADLIKKSGSKNGKNWAFFGCSNFLYGCDYQEWIN